MLPVLIGGLQESFPAVGQALGQIPSSQRQRSALLTVSEVRQGAKALRSHLHKTKQLGLCQRVGVLHMVLCKLELSGSDSV